MLDKTLGVASIMNCQDARQSLSMLLDGDLGLTERIPLELHVNACAECRQKLADLQIAKEVEEKFASRPVHDWRPSLAKWWPTLAHWRPTLSTIGALLWAIGARFSAIGGPLSPPVSSAGRSASFVLTILPTACAVSWLSDSREFHRSISRPPPPCRS